MTTRRDTSVAYRALTRSFLQRFFENEITGGTQDLKLMFFWGIAALAGPLALLPVTLMTRYRGIVLMVGFEGLRVVSRPHKLLVIMLGMTAAALVATIVWNSLMLERRDALILGALPVRGRTIVLSKLAALAIYILMIAAAMHAISSAIFGVILADGSGSVRITLSSPFVHFAVGVLSCAFVFLCVTAVQGTTLVFAGPVGFRRVAPFLQIALVAGIIVAFTKIAVVFNAVAIFNRWPDLRTPEPWLLWIPPVWFLGLYEWMLGNAEPIYAMLAGRAATAFGVVLVTTLVTYALVYRRVMTRVVETADDNAKGWLGSAVTERVTRLLSRHPVRRASAQFFFASIGRVTHLRFVVAVAVGLLCAWIVPALGVVVASVDASSSPRATFALSYVSLLVVLVGVKIAVSMPADLRASWIVPAIDARGRVLRSGLWRALFVACVLPLVVSFAILHSWLWNGQLALVHAGIMLGVGALLVEVTLWHFDDMPSQRPWRPEQANLRFWWPAYLLAFSLITGGLPYLESMARHSVATSAAIAGACLVAALAVRLLHNRPYPIPSTDIETFVEAPGVLKLD